MDARSNDAIKEEKAQSTSRIVVCLSRSRYNGYLLISYKDGDTRIQLSDTTKVIDLEYMPDRKER